jgi:hypothetical protein
MARKLSVEHSKPLNDLKIDYCALKQVANLQIKGQKCKRQGHHSVISGHKMFNSPDLRLLWRSAISFPPGKYWATGRINGSTILSKGNSLPGFVSILINESIDFQ